MKILYFRPRHDEDPPPPRPVGRGRFRDDVPAETQQPGCLVVLDAFPGGRTLPQAA